LVQVLLGLVVLAAWPFFEAVLEFEVALFEVALFEVERGLINEYRLNLMEAKSRQFLSSEMEKFLFSDDNTSPPPGYTPPPNPENL
jgi:hypothetical protein